MTIGELLETAGTPECDTASEAEYEQSCYTYAHIYNNLMTGGRAFDNGAEFLYGDHSLSRGGIHGCRNCINDCKIYDSVVDSLMKLAQFWYFGHISKSLVAKSTTAMNPNPGDGAQVRVQGGRRQQGEQERAERGHRAATNKGHKGSSENHQEAGWTFNSITVFGQGLGDLLSKTFESFSQSR